MFMFLRTAVAVPKISVGNTIYNTEEIIKKMREAEEKNVNLTVFPELCITGYTCADLFFQTTLIRGAANGLLKILETSRNMKGAFAVGLPIETDGQLYNCAAFLQGGKVLGIGVKTFMPNYNEFYEKRWFSSSEELKSETILSSQIGISGEEYEIPIGRNLIFDIYRTKIGIELCEDLWAPLPPSTFLALSGAEVILNLSASNETIAKREYRHTLISQQSARNICVYVYSSAGADESTTDLVFSGHGMICENGSVLGENEKLIDNDYLLVRDVDMQKIKSDRRKQKTFADAAKLYGARETMRTIRCGTDDFLCDGNLYELRKFPFVPSSKDDRLKRCMDIFQMQVSGLRKRMSVAGNKMVIGVSGGLDSTLALLVCVSAAKQEKLDLKCVTGITLPCFGTSSRTYKNALKLMEKLQISQKEINIKNACTLHCDDIGHGMDNFDVTYENIQARERTQVLMDYACKIGGFVVGTGDLSELALGWCTYNADHMSMYSVNASIPKTLIKWMIEAVAEYEMFDGCASVLKDIIATPISPELIPPDENGIITQETESFVGPYALNDFFLYYVLRYGFEPKKIYTLAQRAFCGEYDCETILKWLKMFYRRFFTQQFKRSCLPDGVKVGSVCLSPRGDWRMPSDASFELWKKDLEDM